MPPGGTPTSGPAEGGAFFLSPLAASSRSLSGRLLSAIFVAVLAIRRGSETNYPVTRARDALKGFQRHCCDSLFILKPYGAAQILSAVRHFQ